MNPRLFAWSCFALYYGIGWLVCILSVDKYGEPIPLTVIPFMATVWPLILFDS